MTVVSFTIASCIVFAGFVGWIAGFYYGRKSRNKTEATTYDKLRRQGIHPTIRLKK